MNTSADSQGMDGKTAECSEHDEPSRKTPFKIGSRFKTLAIRLDAIDKKNHENENMITSHQKSVEELLKCIAEDTAIEGKQTAMRDAMLNARLYATERKCLEF